jgi:hypothetical protein
MVNSSIHQFKESEQQAVINWLNLPHDQEAMFFMYDFSRRLIRIENQEKTHYLMAYQGRLSLREGKYYQKMDLECFDETFFHSYFTFPSDNKDLCPPTDFSKNYYVLYELAIDVTSKKDLTDLKPKFITEATEGVEDCINFISDYVGLDRHHPLAHNVFYKGTQNLLGPLAELCILTDPIYLNSQISFASHIILSKDQIKACVKSYSIFNASDSYNMYSADGKWHYLDPSIEDFEVTDLMSQMMALPQPELEKLCQINHETSKSLLSRLKMIPEKLIDLELTLTGDQALRGKTFKSWTHPQLAKEDSCQLIHDKIHHHKFSTSTKPSSPYWYQSPFSWVATAVFFFFYPAATLSISSLLLFAFFYNEKQTQPNIFYKPLPSSEINEFPHAPEDVDDSEEETIVFLNPQHPLLEETSLYSTTHLASTLGR